MADTDADGLERRVTSRGIALMHAGARLFESRTTKFDKAAKAATFSPLHASSLTAGKTQGPVYLHDQHDAFASPLNGCRRAFPTIVCIGIAYR